MRRRILAVLPVILAVACASAPSSQSPPSQGRIPEQYRAEIAQAERLGRLIYEYDRAAWIGTDAVFARFPDAKRKLRGWIVVPEDSQWLVYFMANQEDRVVYAYRVELSRDFAPLQVYEYRPPGTVLAEHLARYRARQLAIESTRFLCDTSYNTVVLPASLIGDAGWLVYLLPASSVPGEQYLGHHRVLVDQTGTSVIRNEALAKTCLRSPPPPDNVVGALVTHLVSPTPIEIHVFRNLVTGRPLYVAAGGNMWSVTNGVVAFHGPLK